MQPSRRATLSGLLAVLIAGCGGGGGSGSTDSVALAPSSSATGASTLSAAASGAVSTGAITAFGSVFVNGPSTRRPTPR